MDIFRSKSTADTPPRRRSRKQEQLIWTLVIIAALK